MYPLLVRFPGLDVYTYSICLGFAFIAGFQLAVVRGRGPGLDRRLFAELALIYFITGLLGAKAAYFLTGLIAEWSMYSAPANQAGLYERFFGTGAMQMGGLLAASISGTFWMRRKKHDLLQVHDILTVPAAAGILIGRLGCFLNGCCFGKPISCGHPLGFDFSGHHSFAALAQSKTGASCLIGAPLLSAAAMAAIIVFILLLEKKPRPPGSSVLVFAFLYFIQRFLVEFARMDTPSLSAWPGLNLNQAFCLLGLTVSALAVYRLRLR